MSIQYDFVEDNHALNRLLASQILQNPLSYIRHLSTTNQSLLNHLGILNNLPYSLLHRINLAANVSLLRLSKSRVRIEGPGGRPFEINLSLSVKGIPTNITTMSNKTSEIAIIQHKNWDG